MPDGSSPQPSVAILIPCLDEERGIAGVVAEFRRELPEARIVVVDNGSADATPRVAAGADLGSRRSHFSTLHTPLVFLLGRHEPAPAATDLYYWTPPNGHKIRMFPVQA